MSYRLGMFAGTIAAFFLSAAISANAQTKAAPGVTDKSITVGLLSVLTGGDALEGLPSANGLEAFFKHVNEDLNGVAGRKIIVLKRDHQSNLQTANQEFAQMVPRVAMFSDVWGTPVVSALRPRIKESGVLVMPGSFGSRLYADPQLIMPFAPYGVEMAAGIDYIVKEQNGKSRKWALIERHDAFGADGAAGFNYATKHYGLNVVSHQTYEPTDTDFTAQILAIKESGADAVVLSVTSLVTPQFVVGLTRLGVHAIWLGTFISFNPGLAKNAEFMSIVAKDKYYIASPLPAWTTKSAGMNVVRQARQKYFPNQAEDPLFTFGYARGAITYAVLQAATKNGDLSRAGINAAVKDVGATDLNGLLTHEVDFAQPPQKRFPRAVQIWTVSESVASYQAPVSDYFTGEAASSFPMP